MKARRRNGVARMRAEYRFDYSKAERGRYFKRLLKEGSNVVVLDRDVAREFPDSASVNRALRSVLKDKPKRNIGQEILEGIREIKRGKHGRVVVRRAPARIKGLRKTAR